MALRAIEGRDCVTGGVVVLVTAAKTQRGLGACYRQLRVRTSVFLFFPNCCCHAVSAPMLGICLPVVPRAEYRPWRESKRKNSNNGKTQSN